MAKIKIKVKWIAIFFIVASIVSLVPTFALFKGNQFFGVEVNLLATDKYNTGIIYTPNCLTECHLPLELKYNGSITPNSISFTINNISSVLNKLNSSDDISISAIKFLINQTYVVPIQTQNIVCTNYTEPSNQTIMQNCTDESYFNNTEKWRWAWIDLPSQITLNKSKYFAIDIIGKRSPNTNGYSTDIVPTVYGFQLPELAWWNSTFSACKNITINNTNNSNALTDYQILFDLNFPINNVAGVRFVNASCNSDGVELNHSRKNYTATDDFEWVKIDSIPASSTRIISVYYNNTSAVEDTSNGAKTFIVFQDFEDGTIGQPATDWYNSGGWTTSQTMIVKSTGTTKYMEHSATGTGNGARNFYNKSNEVAGQKINNTATPFILEGYFNMTSSSNWGWCIDNTGLSPRSMYEWEFYGSGGVFRREVSDSFTPLLYPTNISFFTNTWHYFKVIQFRNSTHTFTDFYINGTENFNYTDNNVQLESGFIGTTQEGGGTAGYDNITIRKWTSPEPIYSFGTPETSCTTPTNNMEITTDTTFCEGTYYLNGVNDAIGIESGNIVLDCNGATLIGEAGVGEGNYTLGINFVQGLENITVKNCVLAEYDLAVMERSVRDVTLDNIKIYNTSAEAITIRNTTNSVLNNIYTYNNSWNGGASVSIDCVGSDCSSNITVKNTECGLTPAMCFWVTSPNITFDNITASSNIGEGANDIIVKNSVFNGCGGIWTWNWDAENYWIENNTFNIDNTDLEICQAIAGWFFNSTFINNKFYVNLAMNGRNGVWIENSNGEVTKPINSYIVGNEFNWVADNLNESLDDYGERMIQINGYDETTNVTIENNIFRTPYLWATDYKYYSIWLETVRGSIIKGNLFVSNQTSSVGISLVNASSNLIYNNLFNDNFYFDGTGANNWNTTYQSGTNIWNSSLGYIGGNLWTTPTNDGFSDTCNDLNADGFCDDAYTLATDNLDYLAIAKTVGQSAPSLSVIFNFTSIGFENVSVNTNLNPATNNFSINVSGTGGCNARTNFIQSDLSYLSYSISNSSMMMNYTLNTTDYPNLLAFDVGRNIDGSGMIYPKYWLNVSSGQYAGTYAGTQTIEGSCI